MATESRPERVTGTTGLEYSRNSPSPLPEIDKYGERGWYIMTWSQLLGFKPSPIMNILISGAGWI
jgi:hypothetical protein